MQRSGPGAFQPVARHPRLRIVFQPHFQVEPCGLPGHRIAIAVAGIARAFADQMIEQAAWFDLKVRLEHDAEPRVPGHRLQRSDA